MTVKSNGGLNQMRTGVRISFILSFVWIKVLSLTISSNLGAPYVWAVISY